MFLKLVLSGKGMLLFNIQCIILIPESVIEAANERHMSCQKVNELDPAASKPFFGCF